MMILVSLEKGMRDRPDIRRYPCDRDWEIKANATDCGTLHARHSRRLELKLKNMDFTPKLLMRNIGEADVAEIIPHVIRNLPDTPPVDVTLEAGLLAHGSSHSPTPSQGLTTPVA